ncbi:MAG: hypothetical protein ABJE47_18920 [bacterium]
MTPRLLLLATVLSAYATPLPVKSVSLQGRLIALSETPLESVAHTWGVAVRSKGDAGDALRWSCLRLAGEPSRVLLLQSSEIDGGLVGTVDLHTAGEQPLLETSCQSTTLAPSDIVTDRGLRAGLSRDSVVRLLGLPTRDSAGVSIYHAETPQTNRTDGRSGFVEYSTLIVVFTDGHVRQFRADYRVIN